MAVLPKMTDEIGNEFLGEHFLVRGFAPGDYEWTQTALEFAELIIAHQSEFTQSKTGAKLSSVTGDPNA
jgi:hypothetical protein